jgi:hypothetical protein
MNQPPASTNVLRSGQPIIITDTNQTVFQGVLLSCQYEIVPPTENGPGGIFLIATLAPSIYQLTISPLIFDATQAVQIQTLTGVNVNAILGASVTQSIATSALLSYIISSMDYSIFFGNTINVQDLSSSVFLMAGLGESRDEVLRNSINFFNCVLYQQEDGIIIIRQLDATLLCPFAVDLQNQYNNNLGIPVNGNIVPIVPMLQYSYTDNAYSTPATVSNYAILAPGLSASNNTNALVISYAPNPTFFPRLKQLQTSGWFVGTIDKTQINSNIVSDPTIATALTNFNTNPDQYMLNVTPNNIAKSGFITSYQSLLTAKALGNALTGYATLNGTISLDDPNLPEIGNIIGSVIDIQNCDLTQGIIATTNRSYSTSGSFLNFNIVPLGSITGYYKNS